MEYIGKKGGWISRIDIALDVYQTILFSLCPTKMIEKRKSRVYKKRRFNRFDEKMLRVTCWVLPCILVSG